MPGTEQIPSDFSLPCCPVFIDRMFCVKDEKGLKEGQIWVLNGIAFPNLTGIRLGLRTTD